MPHASYAHDGFVPPDLPGFKGKTLLSGRPTVIDGVTFRPYRTGISQSERRSDCGRFAYKRNFRMTAWIAEHNGHFVPSNADERKPHRFTTEQRAARAAMRGTP